MPLSPSDVALHMPAPYGQLAHWRFTRLGNLVLLDEGRDGQWVQIADWTSNDDVWADLAYSWCGKDRLRFRDWLRIAR